MPSDTTVSLCGERSVPLKSTGHEKKHFTVVLTARANGVKMKPFVVFKGKGTRLAKELEQIPGIVVRFSSNGWMKDTLAIDYLHSIVGTFSFNKRLLVWDTYCCHTSTAVRAERARLRLHTAIVPGGCTKFIQAADVMWNACFKSKLRSLYDAWLADPAGHEYTRGGNLKHPSRTLLCQCGKSSWEAVPVQMVKDSFITCGITTSTDGSDDNCIHCLKQDSLVPQARAGWTRRHGRFRLVAVMQAYLRILLQVTMTVMKLTTTRFALIMRRRKRMTKKETMRKRC